MYLCVQFSNLKVFQNFVFAEKFTFVVYCSFLGWVIDVYFVYRSFSLFFLFAVFRYVAEAAICWLSFLCVFKMIFALCIIWNTKSAILIRTATVRCHRMRNLKLLKAPCILLWSMQVSTHLGKMSRGAQKGLRKITILIDFASRQVWNHIMMYKYLRVLFE